MRSNSRTCDPGKLEALLEDVMVREHLQMGRAARRHGPRD